jgi:hypothetical protein
MNNTAERIASLSGARNILNSAALTVFIRPRSRGCKRSPRVPLGWTVLEQAASKKAKFLANFGVEFDECIFNPS